MHVTCREHPRAGSVALHQANLVGGGVGETLVVEDVVAINCETFQHGHLVGSDFVMEIVVVSLLPNGQGGAEEIADIEVV